MQVVGPIVFLDTWLDWPVALAWTLTGLCVAALSYAVYRWTRRLF